MSITQVRKHDESADPVEFKADNIRKGIKAALDKSTGTVPQEVVDDIVVRVVRLAQEASRSEQEATGKLGPRVVSTRQIGAIVLDELHASKVIVAVSRIRFAIGFLRLRTMSELGAWLKDDKNWPTNESQPPPDEPKGPVMVRKRSDKPVEAWDQAKLVKSISIAARSLSTDKATVSQFAERIAYETQQSLSGQSLILTEQVSSQVMQILREGGYLVPYLRYATAVKRMRSMKEFRTEYDDVLSDGREERFT